MKTTLVIVMLGIFSVVNAQTEAEAKEKRTISSALQLANHPVNPDDFTLEEMRQMLHYAELPIGQAIREYQQMENIKAMRKAYQARVEAAKKQLAIEAQAAGIPLIQYVQQKQAREAKAAQEEYARIQATQMAEEQRKAQLYQLYLQKIQTDAAVRAANSLQEQNELLSQIQFQQFLTNLANSAR